MLARAAARLLDSFPAVELRIESTTRAEGLRRLAAGKNELHCSRIDEEEPLPGRRRRRGREHADRGVALWPLRGERAGDGTPRRPARLRRG